jgi:regulator of cell morphogenesis and NO signaling
MEAKTQNITAYFEADHDRLDALFNSYRKIKKEDVKKAKPYFREFFKGLRKHIVWEEEVLFPFFEKATGMKQGPTEVMRLEHRKIGEILDRLHSKVRAGNPDTDREEEEVLAVLQPHNQKEENILYPAIDSQASLEIAAELFLQMEEIPAERLQACCGSH